MSATYSDAPITTTAHPVDNSPISRGAGIPDDALDALIAATIPAGHNVTARKSLSSDLWMPSCTCGWSAPPTITSGEAEAVGEAHYRSADGLSEPGATMPAMSTTHSPELVGTPAHDDGINTASTEGATMTTAITSATNVPLPAGAVEAGEWLVTDWGGYTYRNFAGEFFPALADRDWLGARITGQQYVATDGSEVTSVYLVSPVAGAGNGALPSQAVALAAAIRQASERAAALQAEADELAALTVAAVAK